MSDLLPLKTSPFERYMLQDDRALHPMTWMMRLRFSGYLDPQAFAAAVATAVERHPLFAARIDGDRTETSRWVPSPEPLPYLDVAPAGEPMRYPGAEQIDLRRENGLRIWARHGPDAAEVRIQFHHCCCDGVGGYRFAEELFCAYHHAARPGSEEPAFGPLDPALLRRRRDFGLSRLGKVLRLPIEMWGIVVGMPVFLLRRPAALSTPEVPTLSDAEALELPTYPAHAFSVEQTASLRQVTREAGATMNDMLLRETLLAMRLWQEKYDPASRGPMLRIMVPMDLRGPDDAAMPATNVVGMIMIDRRPHRYRDLRKMLRGIGREMNFLKFFRLGLSFDRACAIVGSFRGGMRLLSRANRCFATSVMSNVGRVFPEARLPRRDEKLVMGDLVLDAVESAPPVRPFTRTALTALSYAGKLTLIMNYDRRHFTASAADELMRTLVEQFSKTAAAVPSTEPLTERRTPA